MLFLNSYNLYNQYNIGKKLSSYKFCISVLREILPKLEAPSKSLSLIEHTHKKG